MKSQASLRNGTVSPGPKILAYTKHGSVCRPDQMRYLASIGLMGMHVFEEATSEGSGESAHWHSLSRAYNLAFAKRRSICMPDKHKVPSFHWINAYACFKEASSEGLCKPAHWHTLIRAYTLCKHQVWKYSLSHCCACMFV